MQKSPTNRLFLVFARPAVLLKGDPSRHDAHTQTTFTQKSLWTVCFLLQIQESSVDATAAALG